VNDTEQLIKEALGKLAERTPHPGPTLNALRRKHKRHRNVFLIATAGMAAVAVLIFAGVIASDRYTPPNSNDAAAALIAEQQASRLPLKYSPHWLPMGYAEVYRGLLNGERAYVPAGAQGYPFTDGGPLTRLFKSKSKPDTSGWEEVAVRGLKAWIHTKQSQSAGLTAELVWQAQDWLNVTVRGIDDVKQTAMRVAESVRADSKVEHRAPFTLGGQDATEVWGSSPGDWGAQLMKDPLVVQVSTRSPGLTGGTPITVRGKQGVLVDGAVAVLDGPVWVTVRGAALPGDLVKTANDVQLASSPDTSWIGKGI
jgi:hypothetical protein